MIAATSGGAGDLIYIIPILKQLGVTTIFVKENFYFPPHGNLHQTMKRIMESQGFVVKPCSGRFPVGTFDVPYDYNLDLFREQRGRGTRHIQERMSTHFGVKWLPWPWLTNIPMPSISDYTIIHVTDRWRVGSTVDWRKVLASISGTIIFTGFQHEWLAFCAQYGNVTWFPVDDIFDLATLVNGANAVYCNQTVILTLAQGLGKEYYLERKPGKSNTLLYGKNEHLL